MSWFFWRVAQSTQSRHLLLALAEVYNAFLHRSECAFFCAKCEKKSQRCNEVWIGPQFLHCNYFTKGCHPRLYRQEKWLQRPKTHSVYMKINTINYEMTFFVNTNGGNKCTMNTAPFWPFVCLPSSHEFPICASASLFFASWSILCSLFLNWHSLLSSWDMSFSSSLPLNSEKSYFWKLITQRGIRPLLLLFLYIFPVRGFLWSFSLLKFSL